MTPGARYQAAIECLERIFDDQPAEKVLTNWARSNRYAGSKDRAGVRDIVFDCLRQKRSFMHKSGIDTARGTVIGHALSENTELDQMFSGERYSPSVINADEIGCINIPKPKPSSPVQYDFPDWMEPMLKSSLGSSFNQNMSALQKRASLDLRVNIKKSDREAAKTLLADEGIVAEYIDGLNTGLRVITNPRRVALSKAYISGAIEIQDAGSQAVINALPFDQVTTVLDYCAGGGGKSLAMAAINDDKTHFDAYDINLSRMNDLNARAKRAGVHIHKLNINPTDLDKTYDLVVLDVPCSGTGAWRRNPDAKWRFKQDDLDHLLQVQSDILANTYRLVNANGVLAYMTCSILADENEKQIEKFLRNENGWSEIHNEHFFPSEKNDGFFVSVLKRAQST